MKQQLKILISNDDGINARGIKTLETHLAEIADVLVVAPDRDRSGASSSLTLGLPIRIRRLRENHWCILGTPADSVHLALTGMLQERPDMVVSGINAGANLGDDVLYSGTVAAAIEGRFLGLPAIAISLVYKGRPENFDTASKVAVMIVKRLEASPLPADTILNINVPDLSWDEIQGIRVTRLGRRHQAQAAIADKDPHGRPVYWIGPPGDAEDAGPGTDFDAISNGCVSVTPLQIDLTHYQAMEQLGSWCKSLDLGRNGQ